MGFGGSRFWKAVIISKPGPSPATLLAPGLHVVDDPRAYSDYSPMIFLMYYLDDTSRENGCLRLLPGTAPPVAPAPRDGDGAHQGYQPDER